MKILAIPQMLQFNQIIIDDDCPIDPHIVYHFTTSCKEWYEEMKVESSWSWVTKSIDTRGSSNNQSDTNLIFLFCHFCQDDEEDTNISLLYLQSESHFAQLNVSSPSKQFDLYMVRGIPLVKDRNIFVHQRKKAGILCVLCCSSYYIYFVSIQVAFIYGNILESEFTQ